MKTHITWSLDQGEKCSECRTKTLLLVALSEMKVADEDEQDEHGYTIEIDEEISGHWCPKCRQLRSLSLNT